jgi:hypothetical protein
MKTTSFQHNGYTETRWEPDDEPAPGTKPNGAGTAIGANGSIKWPIIDKVAYHGLAGEVVHTLLPQTESDPVALLLQYLASFGNMVGRGPHVRRANANHYPNIFAFIVGRTSRSRKGTSAQDIRTVMESADRGWAYNNVKSGISSGEGIIEMVRDSRFAKNKKTGEIECIDEGVADKRLLLDEREFSSALNKMKHRSTARGPSP